MISFFSPYRHEFVRVAACVPRTDVANPAFNVERTLELLARGHDERIGLMVFPELGLSAYAIDDLLFQDALLDAVEAAIARLVEASAKAFPVIVVGAPLRAEGRLYNTGVVIHAGSIVGVVPKMYLPNYREFYEKRHFSSGAGVRGRKVAVAGHTVPFGTDLLFRSAGTCPFTFHVEICEDVWVAHPPSTAAALAGAEVLLNLSASNITIGKAGDRRLLCGSQSMRCCAAYAYSAAGPGESTTDLAWDGHAAIFENGNLLCETDRFPKDSIMAVADVDLGRLRQERMRLGSFGDAQRVNETDARDWRILPLTLDAPEEALALRRRLERFPYVPSDPRALEENCYEAYNIQVQGLAQRLRSSRTENAIIGVSGGLDSTHALIVICRAAGLMSISSAVTPSAFISAQALPFVVSVVAKPGSV